MVALTAHCLVKNEENFIFYAVMSVIDHVDTIIIYDTGSEDGTVAIIQDLVSRYPAKVLFEEKGPCDKMRHTMLRQEMLDRTTTDWFMILDGDEVWSERAIREALTYITDEQNNECLIAPFYLCVGDIFHYSRLGQYSIREQRMHATPRFFRRTGVRWSGGYGNDAIVDVDDVRVFEKKAVSFLKNKFWHASHLNRSRIEEVFSSGSLRKFKKVPTYLFIGIAITEEVPEVFTQHPSVTTRPLSWFQAVLNLIPYLKRKLLTHI